MPQALLPLVPDGATAINDLFSVVSEGGQWTYFLGIHPVYQHAEEDSRAFRTFTAQLICQGSCLQSEVVRAFGVAAISVKRSVKKFRADGIEGFYQPRRGRGASVVTPEIAEQAEALLLQGRSRSQVAEQLGIKSDTLRKAILQGRVSVLSPTASSKSQPDDRGPAPQPDPPRSGADGSGARVGDPPPPPYFSPPPPVVTDQSQRTVQDAAAADGLGVACTRVLDRVAASVGLLPGGAATQFQPCRDVPLGA